MRKQDFSLMTAAAEKKISCGTTPGVHHILFLFDQLQDLGGGAERSLLKITQWLPTDRYRVSIATFYKPSDADFFGQFGCPVHVLPFSKVFSWESLKVGRRLRAIIRFERVSIVQTFFETSDLWGSVVAKLSGCPILISSRRDMGFQRTPKHKLAYRLLGPLFDRVHTVSDAVRDFTIQQDRIDPNRVITIPNGVDKIPEKREKAHLRARYGLESASHLVVDVGSIKPIKGYEVLARTAATVCREYPNAVFLAAGAIQDYKYFDQLQKYIAALGLNRNFRFIGLCEDVIPLLQMCDAFCHLSNSDGLSNSLLEAMAAGLPCVISRVGGNPEVVAERLSGFVVPVGDDKMAADRVLTLLRDPYGARLMGEHGRHIIEQSFTAEAMVRKLVRLYDELLATKA